MKRLCSEQYYSNHFILPSKTNNLFFLRSLLVWLLYLFYQAILADSPSFRCLVYHPYTFRKLILIHHHHNIFESHTLSNSLCKTVLLSLKITHFFILYILYHNFYKKSIKIFMCRPTGLTGNGNYFKSVAIT